MEIPRVAGARDDLANKTGTHGPSRERSHDVKGTASHGKLPVHLGSFLLLLFLNSSLRSLRPR